MYSYVLLNPYLCIISFLYLDLYGLGDDPCIFWGSFMQITHLFVLIHIRIRVRLDPQTCLSPPVIFLLTVPRRCFYCGSFFIFIYLCFFFVCHTVLPVLSSIVVTCCCFCCICHFPLWYPRLGVVLNCIES